MASGIPPSYFETLMRELSTLPMWIKQVIYAQLKLELEATMSKATLDTYDVENMLQLWLPDITRGGFQELERPTGTASQGLMKILHFSRFKKSVVNITILNNWSLEQCAIYLREGLDKELINRPKSGVILATIDYLAGKTRLGEYLVNINRVNPAELDQALRTQKYIQESMGERTGIANVLINLGYIHKQDSEGILFLKEESKKPYQGKAAAQQSSPTPPSSQASRPPEQQAANRPAGPPPNSP